jgi:hypothetical protein
MVSMGDKIEFPFIKWLSILVDWSLNYRFMMISLKGMDELFWGKEFEDVLYWT